MSFVIVVLPIIIGFVLDCILGDPYRLPHPVRLIGRFISVLEEYVRKRFKNLRSGGIFLAVIVLFMSTAIPILILLLSYKLSVIIGIIVESVFLLLSRCGEMPA